MAKKGKMVSNWNNILITNVNSVFESVVVLVSGLQNLLKS